jgi:hypothetical protein
MKTSLILKKTGAGHYEVTVMQNGTLIGSFETTDMDLIADIQERNEDGHESYLMGFETFQQVDDFCIEKAAEKKTK